MKMEMEIEDFRNKLAVILSQAVQQIGPMSEQQKDLVCKALDDGVYGEIATYYGILQHCIVDNSYKPFDEVLKLLDIVKRY